MLNSQPLNTGPLNSASGARSADWELYAPVERQVIYVLDVGTTRIPISSVQATMRTTGQSFLQAVIPSGDAWADTLETLKGESMQLRKGYRYKDGSLSPLEIIAAAPFESARGDYGPTSDSLTISGHGAFTVVTTLERTLREVRYRSFQDGVRRVRAGIDLFLRPGHTAIDSDGTAFPVATIQYFINGQTEFMEVLEDG